MARMIPPTVSPTTRSPGEKEVFERLRTDPGTDGWIVLHSFDLPTHATQLTGEVDFVVLIPGAGVLCLEVKAHRRVQRDGDGRWKLGGDPPTVRSPFVQARDNMYSLQSLVRHKSPELCDAVVFWSAVIFTHSAFQLAPTEWRSWEAIDTHAFHTRPLSRLLENVLNQARQLPQLRGKAENGSPTRSDCDRLAGILRPSFEFARPGALARRSRDEELASFTAEQYVALDAMQANPRVVFEGPAGTGKTLIALEAARRHARDGARVGLLCFNHLLGRWLHERAAEMPGQVRASTLHSLLTEISGARGGGRRATEFFQKELPDLAAEKLLDRGDAEFDVLVVDEFQDLLHDSYLDCLDLLLAGGLAAGTWRFFGDFEHQAIYSASVSMEEFRATRTAGAPTYALRTNCRNTPRIANWVAILAELDPGYSSIRRPNSGPPPKTLYYEDEREQVRQLQRLLEALYEDGFTGADIVILSARKDGVATRLNESPWVDRLVPLDGLAARGSSVGWGTAHAFKGLEAPVVVLTDVTEIEGVNARALFYTAATRPTDRLYVLAEAGLKRQVLGLLERHVASEGER